jgi:nucleoside-diphosphate-sugar epimerase
MNILITGANGFLGREMCRLFENSEHTLIATNRQSLDVSKREEVRDFFKQNSIDVVLHAAFLGARNPNESTAEQMNLNLEMYKNLISHSDQYKMMFSFGSGAAYDRKVDIDGVTEDELLTRHPKDFYGMAKNVIARHIREYTDNVVNLRLFGCFGPLEEKSRFISSALARSMQNEPIIVHQDKKMDFFYIEDLYRVIMFYIEKNIGSLPTDINMCYEEKYTLRQIAAEINNLTGAQSGVIINNKNIAIPYTGSGKTLASLQIPLIGLKKGIKNTYEKHR